MEKLLQVWDEIDEVLCLARHASAGLLGAVRRHAVALIGLRHRSTP